MAKRVVPIRPPAPERVVSDTIVFEVGDSRQAFEWKITPLPAAPAAVEEMSKRRKRKT